MLNKQSGLQGLCGDSDMRAIQERVDKGDKDAEVALGVFIKVRRKRRNAPPACDRFESLDIDIFLTPISYSREVGTAEG